MILRIVSAGLCGGLAWIGAMVLLFGPAQAVLANPSYQSEKFLTVMALLEPLPRVAEAWWILPVGLLAIGMIYGAVFHYVRGAFAGKSWWSKGLRFGLVTWAIMVPWFEFYLPWNVMREPLMLVMLEGTLWLGVQLIVGVTIAGIYEWQIADLSG